MLVNPSFLLFPFVVILTSIQARNLTGRFLALTDIHPDGFYKFDSSVSEACHWNKPSTGPRAGYWGTAASDCDSPLSLVNATFDWLEKHLKHEVDFVVWTGDNARHDIDSRKPRSLKEIMQLNRFIGGKIREVFGHIPVISSVGNNDVYPHNIMLPGVSPITSGLLKAWEHFIPEVHHHSFARGGYYSIDAIEQELLLISLNTLYFYDANKAVGGCAVPTKSSEVDPGNEELDWLEQQLTLARTRGMQVWLTGHVPPSQANWYPRCWTRYGQLVLSFQDTIVGNLFGHMNVDHFFWLDAKDAFSTTSPHSTLRPSSLSSFTSAPIDDTLLATYRSLPSQKKINYDDYAIVNVEPSVIPTYLPTLRLWQYNITKPSAGVWKQDLRHSSSDMYDSDQDDNCADDDEEEEEQCDIVKPLLPASVSYLFSFLPSPPTIVSTFLDTFYSSTITARRRKKKKGGGKKRKKPTPPSIPRHADPNSPSRTNTYLSPLGYTQFYLNLVTANENDGHGPSKEGIERAKNGSAHRLPPKWEIEYTTFDATTLATGLLVEGSKGSPIPTTLLPSFVKHLKANERVEEKVTVLEAILKKKGLVPFGMKDLTIPSFLDLARRLGKSEKAWQEYRRFMYVSTD